jgi:NAD(P)-dependent dehydrogenase (short-subunit alcohol dehydrogenase family)
MKELRGNVAVVTGAASGIGRGMVEAFVDEGMKVVLADVEQAALDATVGELREAGAEVQGFLCDVSKPESVDELARRSLEAFGAVHVLCNNAGVAGATPGAIWEQPLDEWDWVMGVNVMGVVHGIRSFMPILLEQKAGGHVVNTASMAGLIPGGGIYGVTKHAVVALSEGMWSNLEAASSEVGVSVLCPGWIRTRIAESERNRPEAPRSDIAVPPEAEMMRKIVEQLIAKGLDPKEVGKLIVDSIHEKRFYVLTHPTWKNMIQQRHDNIMQDKDPIGAAPEGGDWSELLAGGVE